MAHAILHLVAGTPERLDVVCSSCGWSDVWQVAVHSLSVSGVSTVAIARRCIRCRTEQ